MPRHARWAATSLAAGLARRPRGSEDAAVQLARAAREDAPRPNGSAGATPDGDNGRLELAANLLRAATQVRDPSLREALTRLAEALLRPAAEAAGKGGPGGAPPGTGTGEVPPAAEAARPDVAAMLRRAADEVQDPELRAALLQAAGELEHPGGDLPVPGNAAHDEARQPAPPAEPPGGPPAGNTGQTPPAEATGRSAPAGTRAESGPGPGGALLGDPADPQSLIDRSFRAGPPPKPLNEGGQNEQGPALGPIGPEDPATHQALDGPLKGVKYGAELTAAAQANGLSPYLLAGVAAVESGDNPHGKLSGSNPANGGLLQVNPGVWNSPGDIAANANMGARIIRMYIDQAGGDVQKGLNGYNTGDVNQSGYATGYASYAAGVLAGAQNAFKAVQAGTAASLNNTNA